MQEVVVFDLDKTLLSEDSVKTWLIIQFKTHPLRLIIGLLIAPIAFILLSFKASKCLGASLFLWCATVGMSEKELKRNFQNFAQKIYTHQIKQLYWFPDGLNTLQKHLTDKKKVIIATAAPETLAIILFESLNLAVTIVGTPLKYRLGGWTAIHSKYCRFDEKVRRLSILGVQSPWFATYSDHLVDDYPILIRCQHPYLINHRHSKKYLKKYPDLTKCIHYLHWS